MATVAFQDAREYLFPVFEVTATANSVDLATKKFLGTGFFVTPKGDAVTAAHVLPSPEQLPANRRVVAVVLVDGKEVVCWINRSAVLPQYDAAIFQVNLPRTKFFEFSADEVLPGTDVTVVGIPSHQIIGKGLEMRILKGHVTAVMPRLELNFPVPAGMSGSPVLIGTTAVGFATGRVRSEEIDEQTEELVKITGTIEQIQIKTTASIIYYGLAHTFWMLREASDPIFEGKTMLEVINERKREP